MWKITDFGITCEGTSQTMRTSKDGKGTSGYRAPELMADEKYSYNNKVDIWSMGCILYELAVGRKTFYDDLAAMEHKRSQSKLDIVLDEFFSEHCKESITKNIASMLKIEPSSRPSATYLLDEFRCNCKFSQTRLYSNELVIKDFRKVHHSDPSNISGALVSPLQGIVVSK